MSTIGIDPSVRAPAIAVWPSCETWQINLVGDGAPRLLALYSAVSDWATAHAPADLEAVFIERTFGKFEKRALDQAAGVAMVAVLHGLDELFPHPVSCFEVSTSTWKKQALGSGRATKLDVAAWADMALARADEEQRSLTQDEADALAIARAGTRLLEQGDAA